MTIGRLRNHVSALALLALCAGAIATVSCTSNESRVKRLLQESLKPHGVTDVVVDLFYTDPNFPDKAYTSATLTYNFATAEGTPQREFIGYVLAREGDGWRIERSTGYTKESRQAAQYLAGGK